MMRVDVTYEKKVYQRWNEQRLAGLKEFNVRKGVVAFKRGRKHFDFSVALAVVGNPDCSKADIDNSSRVVMSFEKGCFRDRRSWYVAYWYLRMFINNR
ncbi:hypothetical protein U0W77_11325 [Avibacterium paragallinarum]|uniref:hypothetical protein n=1 Tax=Avibacterium paragallinarum TaxID=728 RepID=UPI0039C724D4